jgi:hypothetical protein
MVRMMLWVLGRQGMLRTVRTFLLATLMRVAMTVVAMVPGAMAPVFEIVHAVR